MHMAGDASVNHWPPSERRKEKKYQVFEGGDWRREFEHVGLRFLQDIIPLRSLTDIWLDNAAPPISTQPRPAGEQASIWVRDAKTHSATFGKTPSTTASVSPPECASRKTTSGLPFTPPSGPPQRDVNNTKIYLVFVWG